MSFYKKIVGCLYLFLGMTLHIEAATSTDVFKKYPNKYFIETGSFYGDGIQMALDAGFSQIYSIELSVDFYNHCVNRFQHSPVVHVLQGNSSDVLPILLSQIDDSATFWLDGHYSWGNTARGDTNTPLLAELQAIAQHPIKSHTILIDDVRQFGTIEFDFIEIEEIIGKLMEINPNYVISYEDGYIAKDVLVAKIP